jgi:hypothetical protein
MIPLPRKEILEEIRQVFLHKITELTGVEIHAVAIGANIIVNVRLVQIRLYLENRMAHGAKHSRHRIVFLTGLGAAGIDLFRARFLLEAAVGRAVKPDSLAACAAVNGDVRVSDGIHGGGAFGTGNQGELREAAGPFRRTPILKTYGQTRTVYLVRTSYITGQREPPIMLSEEHQNMMLAYLSGLRKGARLRSLADLAALSSRDLLLLARKVDEAALGLFVQLLKDSGPSNSGVPLFQKLMGDHEEENRHLVDEFFDRYFKSVLSGADGPLNFNPLETYLPSHTLEDLAFVQSRQPFFLRQTIEVINEYLDILLTDNKKSTPQTPATAQHSFQAGEQEQAWAYFWDKVVAR